MAQQPYLSPEQLDVIVRTVLTRIPRGSPGRDGEPGTPGADGEEGPAGPSSNPLPSGVCDDRPTSVDGGPVPVGYGYFDTSNNRPVYWNGVAWYQGNGTFAPACGC